ncbi:hypothetical protein HK097_004040 [Rhizophlyctis rosea]|uniref:C2H2-type domain-containing protein n=1 Tax=Rhizophlyctis rosea TaxID=64517 RepID=A0AAD5X6R8_9FUNG|nr:hypothetical protein HK097_004040 [Rhizophlyctis rosea]
MQIGANRARLAAKAKANAVPSRTFSSRPLNTFTQEKTALTTLPLNYEQLNLNEQFNLARQIPFPAPTAPDASTILDLEQLFAPYNGKDFDLMPAVDMLPQQQNTFTGPACSDIDQLVNSMFESIGEVAPMPSSYQQPIPQYNMTPQIDNMLPYDLPTPPISIEEAVDGEAEDPNTFLTTNTYVVSDPCNFSYTPTPTIQIDCASPSIPYHDFPMPSSPSPSSFSTSMSSPSPPCSPSSLPPADIPIENGLLAAPQSAPTKPRGAKKTFKCTLPGCTKEFTRKYNLASHIRCHSGERPFICPHCTSTEISFARKHDLRRHVKSLHSEMRPHKCTHCSLSFSRSDALKRHLAIEAKRLGLGIVGQVETKEEEEDEDLMDEDEEL